MEYKCGKCGYLIDSEKLTDDFICPFCESRKDSFIENVEPVIVEEFKGIYVSDNNPSIMRIKEKCINCGACKKACLNKVGLTYPDYIKGNPACLNCGQCILACPMAALVPKYNFKEIKYLINDPNKIVIAFVAPAVRVALGEMFGFEYGTNVEGKIVTALKEIGFDYVFDTTFGADLTTMEEAYELLDRMSTNTNLPMFSSCCPSWVKYLEVNHPELIFNLSTCKSPISMQNTIVKTYFAKVKKLNPKDIVTVNITPCTSKKAEIKRTEIKNGDYVLTTSELGLFIKDEMINFKELRNSKFNKMFDSGSGSGYLFGNTGGVSESCVRTIYNILTSKDPSSKLLNFESVRGLDGIKEASIKIKNNTINICVVHGITNLEKLLETDISKYHFIEVMNCYGGCIGGGGQPLVPLNKYEEICKLRMQGLYNCDSINNVRCAYNNPDIIDLYKNYLGRCGNSFSHELLHTTYSDKSDLRRIDDYGL